MQPSLFGLNNTKIRGRKSKCAQYENSFSSRRRILALLYVRKAAHSPFAFFFVDAAKRVSRVVGSLWLVCARRNAIANSSRLCGVLPSSARRRLNFVSKKSFTHKNKSLGAHVDTTWSDFLTRLAAKDANSAKSLDISDGEPRGKSFLNTPPSTLVSSSTRMYEKFYARAILPPTSTGCAIRTFISRCKMQLVSGGELIEDCCPLATSKAATNFISSHQSIGSKNIFSKRIQLASRNTGQTILRYVVWLFHTRKFLDATTSIFS